MNGSCIPKIGERVEIATRYVKKCNRLLDVGCGEGDIAYFLKGKASKIYGIDNSKASLERANEKGIITKYSDLNQGKIPFQDSYFDVITCLDVIEHIKDPINLIAEIRRVLKNGGHIILSAPNIRFSNHLFKLVIRGHFPTTSEDKSAYEGGHIHYFTFSDLRGILEKGGFRITLEKGIINRLKRGIKGRIAEKILGKKFMREFRSPGILIVARKKS